MVHMSALKRHSTVTPRKGGSEPTTNAPAIAAGNQTAEFAGHAAITAMFGIGRTHLFNLDKAGLIKSVALRQRGKLRGRRLYVVESIRALLLANIAQSNG
jgi:hypothetical protein